MRGPNSVKALRSGNNFHIRQVSLIAMEDMAPSAASLGSESEIAARETGLSAVPSIPPGSRLRRNGRGEQIAGKRGPIWVTPTDLPTQGYGGAPLCFPPSITFSFFPGIAPLVGGERFRCNNAFGRRQGRAFLLRISRKLRERKQGATAIFHAG